MWASEFLFPFIILIKTLVVLHLSRAALLVSHCPVSWAASTCQCGFGGVLVLAHPQLALL